MTAKEQLISLLVTMGYDTWTAAKHASKTIADFLASSENQIKLHVHGVTVTLSK